MGARTPTFGVGVMVISPLAIQKATYELRSRGRVPCFVVTAPEDYHDSRCAYGLDDEDILQIAGMMVLPVYSPPAMDTCGGFLMFSVNSELVHGGVS